MSETRRFRAFDGKQRGVDHSGDGLPLAGCDMLELPRPARSKRATMRRALLVLLATFIACEPALAGTLVEFPNLPGREPKQLMGYLAQPGVGLSALLSTTQGDP